MGDTDGCAVGPFVGTRVGALVGKLVVGDIVGAFVGLAVGAPVGASEGQSLAPARVALEDIHGAICRSWGQDAMRTARVDRYLVPHGREQRKCG